MQELPKVIKEMESNIRKAYSLFFHEKLLSKQELITIENAPQRLNLAMQRFYNSTKSHLQNNPIRSVALEQVEDDYQPKQSGILYGHSFVVSIDLTAKFGNVIQKAGSLVDNANLKPVPLVFDLKVRVISPGRLR